VRVAVLTSSWPLDEQDPGGAFVYRSCQVLQAAGCTLEVYPLQPGRSLDGARVEPLGGALATAGGGLMPTLRRRPWLVARLVSRLIARHSSWRRADRVVCHWSVPFALMAQAQGVPAERLRSWCHGSDLRLPGAGWLLGRAHPVALVCEHQRSRLPARFQASARVIPVPIDGVAQPPQPPAQRLIFVGRLIPQKGCDLLPELLDQLPGWEALVVGDGPLRSQLERDPRIRCLGAKHPSVWPTEVGAGVGVCLSRRAEGAPLVVDELRLAGVPVVVSSVDGLRQRVEQSVDGWIVEGFDPRRWALAIERAYQATTWSQAPAIARSGASAWSAFCDWVMR